jgi:hypothetical protein
MEKKILASCALTFSANKSIRGVPEEEMFFLLETEAKYQGLTVAKYIKTILAEGLKNGQITTTSNESIVLPAVSTTGGEERQN